MAIETAWKDIAKSPGAIEPHEAARIARIKDRYQSGPNYISIERAKYYTESWQATEGQPLAIRVALAMKNVYENMTMFLDPDDRRPAGRVKCDRNREGYTGNVVTRQVAYCVLGRNRLRRTPVHDE